LQHGVKGKVMHGVTVSDITLPELFWFSFSIASATSSPVKSKTSVLKSVSSLLPSLTPDSTYPASRSYNEPSKLNYYISFCIISKRL
jgi:hypothetical protein